MGFVLRLFQLSPLAFEFPRAGSGTTVSRVAPRVNVLAQADQLFLPRFELCLPDCRRGNGRPDLLQRARSFPQFVGRGIHRAEQPLLHDRLAFRIPALAVYQPFGARQRARELLLGRTRLGTSLLGCLRHRMRLGVHLSQRLGCALAPFLRHLPHPPSSRNLALRCGLCAPYLRERCAPLPHLLIRGMARRCGCDDGGRSLGNPLRGSAAPIENCLLDLDDAARLRLRCIELDLLLRDLLRNDIHACALRFLLRGLKALLHRAEIARTHREPISQPTTCRSAIISSGLLHPVVGVTAVRLTNQLPCLAQRGVGPLEQRPDLPRREILVLPVALQGGALETHLKNLQAEHFVLDEATGDQSVHTDLLRLTNPVGSIHRLGIGGRVPCRVHHHDTISSGQVQTDPADAR
mmetsp:Transcript_89156/g.251009  ORF Transcript_89156/g.251009 Transcript_89156/m.251009 type:complete len:407 (+) Transcript_89156:1022-2242(+)